MKNEDLAALQRKEANKRIDMLINKFNLNPHVKDYFNEERVYYSYITGGVMGSIDTIEHDARYVQMVSEFEKLTHSLVYHAIESHFAEIGDMLALLYVSNKPKSWPAERLQGDCITAGVYNLDFPVCPEIGPIIISRYMNSGCLVRVG